MAIAHGTSPHVHHLRVDSAGRVVIPAELRRRWHLEHGDTLVLTDDEHGVRLKSLDEVVRESQEYFTKLTGGSTFVDELLTERRAEAERE